MFASDVVCQTDWIHENIIHRAQLRIELMSADIWQGQEVIALPWPFPSLADRRRQLTCRLARSNERERTYWASLWVIATARAHNKWKHASFVPLEGSKNCCCQNVFINRNAFNSSRAFYYYDLCSIWTLPMKLTYSVISNIVPPSFLFVFSFCYFLSFLLSLKNPVAWVRERTIPTELPPLVGEVSTNFCGERLPRGQRDESLRQYSRLSRPVSFPTQPLFFSFFNFLTFSFSFPLYYICGSLFTAAGRVLRLPTEKTTLSYGG
jgi:hypothetical protein